MNATDSAQADEYFLEDHDIEVPYVIEDNDHIDMSLEARIAKVNVTGAVFITFNRPIHNVDITKITQDVLNITVRGGE